jgi:hypothetical protein
VEKAPCAKHEWKIYGKFAWKNLVVLLKAEFTKRAENLRAKTGEKAESTPNLRKIPKITCQPKPSAV